METIPLGQTYDSLTVIGFEPKNKKAKIICRCVCGNQVFRTSVQLRFNEINSCGCKRSARWGGVGTLSRTFFCYKRQSAEQRGIPFTVTMEQLWDLLVQQKHTCKISGLPLILDPRNSGIYTTASIDRIDNNKGYTIDNIQWVHKDVNLMKSFLPEERFFNLCYQITIFNKLKPGIIDYKQTQKPRKPQKMVTRPRIEIPITEKDILKMADEFYDLYGKYPTCKEKRKVPNQKKPWSTYNSELKIGLCGLTGGSSLSKLLSKKHQNPHPAGKVPTTS
jgi:hypothetical protein